MAITFNPQVRFTSEQQMKKDAGSYSAPTSTQPAQPAEKKAPVRGFISKLAYAWINLSEGVRGVVNGLLAGFISGTMVAGADFMANGFKQIRKGNLTAKEMFKTPTKALGKVGKIVAPVVAGFVFVTNLIMAKLSANKRTANVDHQLYTGHRN